MISTIELLQQIKLANCWCCSKYDPRTEAIQGLLTTWGLVKNANSQIISQNQKLSGWGPATCILTSLEGILTLSSLRTSALEGMQGGLGRVQLPLSMVTVPWLHFICVYYLQGVGSPRLPLHVPTSWWPVPWLPSIFLIVWVCGWVRIFLSTLLEKEGARYQGILWL